MFGRRSKLTSPNKIPSNRLNSTVPILPSSPIVTRKRSTKHGSDLSSVAIGGNAATPQHGLDRRTSKISDGSSRTALLSSPFMPQIKRALGLEPVLQNKYSQNRRHSIGIGLLPKSPPVSAGSLPLVKLGKARRLSLTERNSSMLNRTSTVKIAPPVIGKVASPCLYSLRCSSTAQEERGTPDTYAVISALKERRKRSINAFEDQGDLPGQLAKRRRQESQHSNASTSSMPSLPDNFPDITNPDFSMRLETPGMQVKRPSRPSQEEVEEWDTEQETSLKRARCETKNNAILSSLSSSRRFIENQRSKRKAETSFSENENEKTGQKSQKKEPPKLTHIDIPQTNGDTGGSTAIVQQVIDKVPPLTNGHSEPAVQKNSEQSAKTSEASQLLDIKKRMPSLKKTPSMFTGLSPAGSFEKSRYANVYATLDDYESDRKAEKQRVKQMLDGLDDYFTKKEEKSSVVATTEVTKTTTAAATTSVSVMPTTTVTLATTSSFSITSSTKSSEALSALEKMTRSPVQETCGNVTATSGGSQPGLTGLTSTAPSTAGFTFNLQKSTQTTANNLIGLLGSTPATASATNTVTTPSTSASTLPKPSEFSFGLPGPASTKSNTATLSFGGSSTSATVAPSVVATTAGSSFGSTNTTASTVTGFGLSATTAGSSFGSTNTTASTVTGFGLSAASSSTPGGFTFNPQPKTTSSAAGGFTFNPAAKVGTTNGPQQRSEPTFKFGVMGSSVGPASVSSGVSSAAGGFSFGSAGSSSATTKGLTTGQTGSSGSFGSTAAGTTSGFPFGTKTTTTVPSASFGVALASSAPSPFGVPAQGTTQTLFGATSSSNGPFGFGAVKTTASSSPFSIAVTSTNTAAGTSAPFSFTASSTSTSSSSAPFSFNAGPTKTTTGASAPFSFGVGSTNTTAGSSAPFAFGAASTATSAGSSQPAAGLFQFGAAQTTAGPAFGSATGQQGPVFGTASQAPAFGTANQTPAFGASNTPVFGSSNQAPAFGATANQTSAFGAATNQSSAFGATTNQSSAFGSATPTFGASSNQNVGTPAFGGSGSSSVFGNTAPGIPKSNSMPVFGTVQDASANQGTFNFGNPAPNVNPFGQGQTTPAKQTGAAFGQAANDVTPKAQTGSMFAFGQSNNNSSSAKGFDFSMSANQGGYNFMNASSVPVFTFGSAGATPSATSNFNTTPGSTPGPFSVGTAGAGVPRPRAVARAQRRRTARK